MLNRSAFPPALAAESPDKDPNAESLSHMWHANALRWFHLPSSLQGYLIFLLCLLILAFTMVLHVTLSAEILRLNVVLGDLQDENERIERHNANLIWLISQRSSLADASRAAKALDYAPITETRYVIRGAAEAPPHTSEPIMSQSQSQPDAGPPWWSRVWARTRGMWSGARAWVYDRTGW